MKKFWMCLLLIVALTVALAVPAAADEGAAVTFDGNTAWETVVAGYDATTSYVKLEANITGGITVNTTMYIDLNGHSIDSVTINADATLYVFDSKTKAYSVDEGFGTIEAVSGEGTLDRDFVLPAAFGLGRYRYITVYDETDGYSAHRIYLRIHSALLAPKRMEVNYLVQLQTDEYVISHLDTFTYADGRTHLAYGVVLKNLTTDAVTDPAQTGCIRKTAEGLTPYEAGNEDRNNYRTIQTANMFTDATLDQAKSRAEIDVEVKAYLRLDDGLEVTSSAMTKDFHGLVEAAQDRVAKLSDIQINAMHNMYANNIELMKDWDVPIHCICGGDVDDSHVGDCTEEEVLWKPWMNITTLPTASGYYYIPAGTGTVALSKTTYDSLTEALDIAIDLNGNTLNWATAGRALTFGSSCTGGVSLTFTDTSATHDGQFKVTANGAQGMVSMYAPGAGYAGHTLTLYRITMDASAASTNGNGVAINMDAGNTLKLFKATVKGGTAFYSNTIKEGGAIYTKGTVVMENATIIADDGEKVAANGGALYIAGGTVTMNGGRIVGGNVDSNGGAVQIMSVAGTTAELIMNQAEDGTLPVITAEEKTVGVSGGAVCVNGYSADSTFTMNAGTVIGGTVKATGGGGAVCVQDTASSGINHKGQFTMNGGEIRGGVNNAAGGGNVRVTTGGVFRMNGGTITGGTDNSTNQAGGVVLAESNSAMTIDGNAKVCNNNDSYDIVVTGTNSFTIGANWEANGGDKMKIKVPTVDTNGLLLRDTTIENSGWGGSITNLKIAIDANKITLNDQAVKDYVTGDNKLIYGTDRVYVGVVDVDAGERLACGCGASGEEAHFASCPGELVWKPWTEAGAPNVEGNWYLTADVNYSGDNRWKIADADHGGKIYVDLNGYDIRYDSTTLRLLTVYGAETAEIIITDSLQNNAEGREDRGTITVAGNTGAYGGSVIYMLKSGSTQNSTSTLDIYRITIDAHENTTTKDDGAIRVQNGHTLNLHGVTVNGNNGTVGSAISVRSSANVTLEDCTITGTSITSDTGGAIYVNSGKATLVNTIVNGCAATNGGAIYMESGTLNVTGGTINGGAVTKGGALYVNAGTVEMDGATLNATTTGTAATNGGVIYAQAGDLTLTGCTVSAAGATTSGTGAAIWVNNAATMTVSGGSVTGGTVTNGQGGAICNLGSLTINNKAVINGGTLQGTDKHGGAIYVGDTNAVLNIDDATVNGGTVNAGGGAAISINTGEVTISNSTINGGTVHASDAYGGTVKINAGSAEFVNTTVTGSTGSKRGSGVYVSGGTVNWTGGTVEGVNVGTAGAAVCVKGGGSFTMESGTLKIADSVTGNVASYGGTVVVDGASAAFELKGGDIVGGKISWSNADNPYVGGGAVRVISGTFTMSGGTITGGTTGKAGGAIDLAEATFTMSGGTINGGSASTGGAICVRANGKNSTFTMTNGMINAGTATNGGAVYLYSADNGVATLDISGGTINGGAATNGGAIYVENGALNATGGTISGGAVTEKGGALYVNAGTVQMNGATLNATTTGTAATNGGVIYAQAGDLTLTGCTVSAAGATTSGTGAAIWVNNNATMTVSGGSVTGGTVAAGNGGAICSLGSLTINNDAVITGGTVANGNGGALYIGDGTVEITGGTIHGGKAKKGGAIYHSATTLNLNGTTLYAAQGETGTDSAILSAQKGTVVMTNCTVDASKATTTGTGSTIYVAKDANMTISGGSVTGGTVAAGNGGAICNLGSLTINNKAVIYGGTIAADHAAAASNYGGGAIYSNKTLNIDDSTIYGGTVTAGGSAISLAGGSTTNITNSTIGGGNPGTSFGGVIRMVSGTLNITDSQINPGTGVKQGGCLYIGGGTVNMYGGEIAGGDVSSYGGAIYLTGENTAFTMDVSPVTHEAPVITAAGKTSNNAGAAVYIKGAATTKFNMNAGTIVGGTSTNVGGGAVGVEIGTFNMSGGTITGGNNTGGATFGGGNVRVTSSGVFNLMGGTITGGSDKNGKGGGVHVNGNGQLNISGTGKIYGNTGCDVYINTATASVTLDAGWAGNDSHDMVINSAVDTQIASPAVTVDAWYAMRSAFTAIDGGRGVYLEEDKVVISVHYTCICGAHEDEEHIGTCNGDKFNWTPVSSAEDLLKTSGYYYLTQNIELTSAYSFNENTVAPESGERKIFIDLNGYTLSKNNDRVIAITTTPVNVELTILDSSENRTGKVSRVNNNTNNPGALIWMRNTHAEGVTGIINVYRTTLDASGVVTTGYGVGIAVETSNTLNLYNATVLGGTTSTTDGGGGAIYNTGTVNMVDSIIDGGSAYCGGAIYNAGVITMNGGEIRNGVASSTTEVVDYGGGNVYIAKGGVFRMNGGLITGGSDAYGKAGGVMVTYQAQEFSISGAAQIRGNNSSDLYLGEGKTVSIDENWAGNGVQPMTVILQNGEGLVAPAVGENWNNTSAFWVQNLNDYYGYGFTVLADGVYRFYHEDELVYHCVCGEVVYNSEGQVVSGDPSNCIGQCDGVMLTWRPWYSNVVLPYAENNYYLVNNVFLRTRYNNADAQAEANETDARQVRIDLKAKTVNGAKDRTFVLRDDAEVNIELTLTDSTDAPGTIKAMTNYSEHLNQGRVIFLYNSGENFECTANVYRVTLDAEGVGSNKGAAACVDENHTLNLYNATVKGGTTNEEHGGAAIHTAGTVYMDNTTVVGGSSNMGSVHVFGIGILELDGTTTISGGKTLDGSTDCNVYLYPGSYITLGDSLSVPVHVTLPAGVGRITTAKNITEASVDLIILENLGENIEIKKYDDGVYAVDPSKENTLEIGYGEANINPTTELIGNGNFLVISGYGHYDQYVTSADEEYPLKAIAVAFTDEQGDTVLMITVDQNFLSKDQVDEIKKEITLETGIPGRNITISANHNHSAPFTTDKQSGHQVNGNTPVEHKNGDSVEMKSYWDVVREGTLTAAFTALDNRAEVSEVKTVRVNVNSGGKVFNGVRNYEVFGTKNSDSSYGYAGVKTDNHTAYDSTAYSGLKYEPESQVDDEVQLVQYTRKTDGKKVVLANFQTHPNVLASGDNTVASSDMIGVFRNKLGTDLDANVMYISGAGGNINAVEGKDDPSKYYSKGQHVEYGIALANVVSTAFGGAEAIDDYSKDITVARAYITVEAHHEPEYVTPYGADSPVHIDTRVEMAKYIGEDESRYNQTYAAQYGIYSKFHARKIVDKSREGYGEETRIPIDAYGIGDIALAAAPYEMFDSNGKEIKTCKRYSVNENRHVEGQDGYTTTATQLKRNGFKMTMIATQANGTHGYIASLLGYANGGYSVDVTRYAEGSGEELADGFLSLLNQMKKPAN